MLPLTGSPTYVDKPYKQEQQQQHQRDKVYRTGIVLGKRVDDALYTLVGLAVFTQEWEQCQFASSPAISMESHDLTLARVRTGKAFYQSVIFDGTEAGIEQAEPSFGGDQPSLTLLPKSERRTIDGRLRLFRCEPRELKRKRSTDVNGSDSPRWPHVQNLPQLSQHRNQLHLYSNQSIQPHAQQSQLPPCTIRGEKFRNGNEA